MELVGVAPDVWACLQEDRGLGCSNSGLVTRGGGLVVDTFWDLPHTRALIATYGRVWRGPVRRVVNTHHNGDHCWGNQLFPEAEVIGHRLCAASFGRESPAALQALRAARAGADPALAALGAQLASWDFSGIEPRPPTTLVDDRLDLDLDGLAVELRYVGPAHPAGDLIVHVPGARVVFAGDVVFHRCTPLAWEGTYDAWLAALDAIVALDPAVVVPGLGGRGPAGDAGLPRLRARRGRAPLRGRTLGARGGPPHRSGSVRRVDRARAHPLQRRARLPRAARRSMGRAPRRARALPRHVRAARGLAGRVTAAGRAWGVRSAGARGGRRRAPASGSADRAP